MSEPLIRISEVMRTNVLTVSRMATVQEAINLMQENRLSSLAVERKDANDEYGILLISDIAKNVIASGKSAERTNVYEIMTKPVLSVQPEMTIRNGIRILVNFGISRALVVDTERKPVGIVTLRDMVLRYAEKKD
ncbi:MAG: CBS domain-containing protein [Magnetovibrionaceae bacterium]